MVTTEQAVEKRSPISHRRASSRKTPQEIEGFQSVVLRPGGQVDLLNISNGGMLVQT